MTKPLLSIIIPAYNCSHRVEPIVKSILNQSVTDFELIIVNDKSTDNTASVIKRLSADDKRIKAINQLKNGGAAEARNAGIKLSAGRYIMFFDADDNIKPETISSLLSAIKSPGVELAVSGMTINSIKDDKITKSLDVCTNSLPVKNNNEPFKLYIIRLLGLDGRLYQIWNKVYLGSIIRDNKLSFQNGINFGEDLLFNLDYFSCMTKSIKFIDKPLYIYNQELDGGTFSKSSLKYDNRMQNYRALEQFSKDLPDTIVKSSLMVWIKYYWIYSFALAISSSNLSRSDKLMRLRSIKQKTELKPLSDRSIIGNKKYLIEATFNILAKSPTLLLLFMNLMNFVKSNRLTGEVWQRIKR